ncbi:MAG: glycerol kinase GlpK [Terracidiphilus sp.]
MPVGLILAIDQGTTNTKGLLVGRSGEPVFRAATPVSLIYSASGFVEQDPNLLLESVMKVIAECKAHADHAGARIEALAISNQRETAVAWNSETGEPVANAISWQCGRSAEICDRLTAYSDEIRMRTGLPLAPLVTAGKWAWLLQNNQAARDAASNGTLCLGTVDSWIINRLTAGATHATDFSNASRTGLLNLENLSWDDELLAIFGIPRKAMPQIRPSAGAFGSCSSDSGLRGVPVLAAIGDSHAAMFGHGHYAPGAVKATYGTGSSLMMLTQALLPDNLALARTIAWSISGRPQFALEGNIAMTGSAVQWVGEFLQLPNPIADAVALAASVPDADGIYFVPAMVGLGAPYWDSNARGTIAGIGRSHTSAHLARAAIDAIAYQVADVLFAMEEMTHGKIHELLADGGATRNAKLIQFQADILGRPVLRSSNEELSALGAALLAGLAHGWWGSLAEIQALPRTADRFEPSLSPMECDRLYHGWQQTVRRARLAPEVGA